MNPLFQAVFECLGGSASDNDRFDNAVNEKSRFKSQEKDKAGRSAQDIAQEFIDELYSAEKNGRDLVRTLDSIIGEYGWVENIGVAILNGLERAIQSGVAMGPVMKEMFDKATDAAAAAADTAIGFAKDHPIYCTIIAIGILVLLAPYVLELIGFGELGPIEASWAARWQATYNGYVPKDSLFAFFQRLGMVWKRIIVNQDLITLAV